MEARQMSAYETKGMRQKLNAFTPCLIASVLSMLGAEAQQLSAQELIPDIRIEERGERDSNDFPIKHAVVGFSSPHLLENGLVVPATHKHAPIG
jgi:hypothetical protein